jgi:hypothetical protein
MQQNLGGFRDLFYPIFILYHALLYTNMLCVLRIVSSLCIAKFPIKISKNIWIFYPIFILYYDIPYTNLHTKFRKNPCIFVDSRANTNVHRFHAQTASWWPF